MKRYALIFIIISFTYYNAYAQLPLTGKVYELHTHITLQYIKVQNTRTKDNTQTNATGIFSIQAKAGDILILEGFAYQPDTLVVVNARYLEIYLTPKNTTLKEVKIENTTTKLGNLKDPSLKNQAVVYQRDANGNAKGGVALRFGYGKSSKEKKDEQRTYKQLATEEIDAAFSPANINQYIPLTDTLLKQFIELYRPTIKQYKAPNFDLTIYLNDCYKKFLALAPAERKLPALKADTVKN